MDKTTSVATKNIFIILLAVLGSVGSFISFDLWTNGVILLCVYAVSIWGWIKSSGKIASLYFMFVLYCMLSNAGLTLLYTFGITFDKFVDVYSIYPAQSINKMLSFQSLCIAALSIGALIAHKPDKSNEISIETEESESDGTINLNIVDIVYLVLLALMFILYIMKFFTRSSMNYHDFFYGDTSGTGVDIRIALLFYAFLYASYYNHINDGFRKFIYISSAALAFLVMSVGSRGLTIPLILGLLFVRSLTNKPLPKLTAKTILKWGILAIALLYLLQAFKVLRGYSISDWNGEVLANAFGVGVWEGLLNILSEMGGSARCVIVTMTHVDASLVENEPTILYAILKMFIPVDLIHLIGVNPSIGFLSTWVTEAGGADPNVTGWGYSIIGEVYLNWGKLGWILMLILGFSWIKLEKIIKKMLSGEHKIAAMALVYVLAYSIFLARAEMLLVSTAGRYAFYVLIISVFMVEILHTKITLNLTLGSRKKKSKEEQSTDA